MTRKDRFVRAMVGVAILAMAECAGLAAVTVAVTGPAEAQFWDQRSQSSNRQRPSRGGGFFDQLFGPYNSRDDDRGPSQRNSGREREQAPADYSRAPSPRKPDKDAPSPTTSVVVLGDSMADWLAYGLEDAFADMPEVGIVRKAKAHSGLIHYDAKGDLDWWHVARDILNGEKPNYVIMMLGVSDRDNIRERDIAIEKEKSEAEKKKEEADKNAPQGAQKDPNDKTAQNKEPDDAEAAPLVAPEPPQPKKSNGVLEFRSDPWEKIYSRRIDATIAALRSKGVPVFWVGLPSIRGAKSTADAVYLNDLYRARAEKAGAVYIDVWDGFVDEGGKYATYGPDYEGQMRRLRTGDGVYFTKYGARKLAHYVERELRRYMSNRSLQVSLPSGPMGPVPGDGTPAARPLAGPVVPLTMPTANSDELLGGRTAMARGDATATNVLVKGDAVTPPQGRADNFIWPPGSTPQPAPVAAPAKVASKPPVAVASPEQATSASQPVAVKPEPARAPAIANTEPVAATPEPGAKSESKKPAAEHKPVEHKSVERKTEPKIEKRPQRAVDNRPRPPASVGRQHPQQQPPRRSGGGGLFDSNGPFGWIR